MTRDDLKFLGLIAFVSVIVVLAILLFVNAAKVTPNQPEAYCSWYPSTFLCRDIEVKNCLKSEEYSLDQCLQLVGGNTGNK